MAKLKDTEIEGLFSLYDGGGGKLKMYMNTSQP